MIGQLVRIRYLTVSNHNHMYFGTSVLGVLFPFPAVFLPPQELTSIIDRYLIKNDMYPRAIIS